MNSHSQKSKRIHIICEGQTEEMFVNLMLHPHFSARGIDVRPKILGTTGHQGGNVGYKRIVADMRLLLETDPHSYITTFIDFYGIYSNFPGVPQARKLASAAEKFETVIYAFKQQLANDFSAEKCRRIIPYIQMHEFEGLLFCSPEDLAAGIFQLRLKKKFANILFQFETPEDINDSIETAPSKRILHFFRGYQKVLHGAIIVRRIGLAKIRGHCPLFDHWLHQMEALVSPSNLGG